MTDERRYTGSEIEWIFERAARRSETPAGALAASDGLTLRQLKEIGREVGIAPDLVSEAASSLERGDGYRRTLGLPLRVAWNVPLHRDLSDLEWERLVADLRHTFRAAGRVSTAGGLRHWRNGNLHAFVEPTTSGYRLRMGTTKGDARQLLAGGAGAIGVAGVLLLLSLVSADPELTSIAGFLSAVGAGSIGLGALQLPGWAARRREQMREIGDRLLAALSRGAPAPEE